MPVRNLKFKPNSKYHVFNRRFLGYKLFGGVKDVEKFRRGILKYSERYKVRIVAYAIMDTHYHLLLMPVDGDSVSKFVCALQKSYAQYLNIKTKRIGQVFQGRYKAKVIDTPDYHRYIKKYILKNPSDRVLEMYANDMTAVNLPEGWGS